MRNWLRRVDPAFYHKERYVLRAQAQIARYTDDAQMEVRLSVLRADRMLHAATTIVALSAYAAAVAAGALDPRHDGPAVWAFAVLAVAAPRALPWWPRGDGRAYWVQALIGSVLVLICAAWTHLDLTVAGVALLAGASLFAARGRGRDALLVVAAGVLFGARVPPHLLVLAPLVGALAAAIGVIAVRAIERAWRVRPQVMTWSAFAALLLVCAYAFAFEGSALAARVPAAIAAIALAYVGVCVLAGRIRRAELIASPAGVLSLPQSVVPLLDRSQHHAVICWAE